MLVRHGCRPYILSISGPLAWHSLCEGRERTRSRNMKTNLLQIGSTVAFLLLGGASGCLGPNPDTEAPAPIQDNGANLPNPPDGQNIRGNAGGPSCAPIGIFSPPGTILQ